VPAEQKQEIDTVNNTNDQDEFDARRDKVRVYAVIIKRRSKWASPETVARLSGLSLSASTSALWSLRREGVAEWKWKGTPGMFRVLRQGTSSRRAELDYEARRLRLIAGPWMKPLFGFAKQRPQ
jgi:hypothetical protein